MKPIPSFLVLHKQEVILSGQNTGVYCQVLLLHMLVSKCKCTTQKFNVSSRVNLNFELPSWSSNIVPSWQFCKSNIVQDAMQSSGKFVFKIQCGSHSCLCEIQYSVVSINCSMTIRSWLCRICKRKKFGIRLHGIYSLE